MGLTATENEGTIQLTLDGEMTIYNAAELKAELEQYWNKATEIELNLSGVDELDSAGLQILLQLKKDSENFVKPVRFVQHSTVVIEALEMLNLIGQFGDPIVLSANRQEA